MNAPGKAPETRMAGWTYEGCARIEGTDCHRWRNGLLFVLATAEVMEAPDGSGDAIPHWLVSVTRKGKRASDEDTQKVLRAFGMVGADEDNHTPGQSRAFFMPCDPGRRVGCECKVTEQTITEADGYQWTTPTQAAGEQCRGCEYGRKFRCACPFHGLHYELGDAKAVASPGPPA